LDRHSSDPTLSPLYRDLLAHYGAVALSGRVRWRPVTEIHLAEALPADQRLRAYAQRIAHAHHHVPALSAKRSRPGDSARLDDKWKNWGFSDAEIKGREYWDQYIEAFTFAVRSALQPRFSL
jgi:hypothetical protein